MEDYEVDAAMETLIEEGRMLELIKAVHEKWDTLLPAGAKAYIEWARMERTMTGWKNTAANPERVAAWTFNNPPELSDDDLPWVLADHFFHEFGCSKTKDKVCLFLIGKCSFDEVTKIARLEAEKESFCLYPKDFQSRVMPSEEKLRAHAQRIVDGIPGLPAYMKETARSYLAGASAQPGVKSAIIESYQSFKI